MAHAEKRKKLRRSVTYPAYLDLGDGSPVRVCTLCDASEEGAQLAVADPQGVPDTFILALSADGAARRHCRVVWRTEMQIGVEFVREGKAAAQPRRMPVAPPIAPIAVQDDRDSGESSATQIDVDTLVPR
jgi:hypothetical protein